MKIQQLLLVLVGGVLSLCGCSRVDLLNLTIPRDGYAVTRDIAYGDDVRQKLDIYVPDRPAPGNPVIVFFYGGSWQMGDKKDYLFVGQAFASRGYVTVIVDYRLYPQIYFPAFLEDCARAFVWTHRNIAAYQGNADHLFLSGHSAGAYNAVMLATNQRYIKDAGGNPAWIKGVAALAGPYDFLPFTDPKIIALFSTAPDAATQPITYVKAGLAPMLLLHGDKDDDVLLRNSINMAAQLRSFGDPVVLKIYPGLEHIGIVLSLAKGFRDKAPVLDDVDAFIKEQLR
jgi:acetyl esterase/lipase